MSKTCKDESHNRKKCKECKEETLPNSEYCIFHKPNKNEDDAREFYEKFLKKFKHRIEKFHKKGKETERFVFEETLNCRRYIFPKTPDDVKSFFLYAIFKGNVEFSMATFNGYTGFLDVIFKGDASFLGTTFERSVEFGGTTFKGDVGFSNAIFKRDASFLGTTFERSVEFYGVVFERYANFSVTTFERYASFSGTTFEEGAEFWNSIFKGDVGFSGTTFDGYTGFRETIFKGDVGFSDASFKGDVGFSGTTFKEDVSFSDAIFKGDVSFSKATFEGFIDFNKNIKYMDYKFEGDLDFSNTFFRKGINIDIPSKWFKFPKAQRESFRVQRLCYEKEGKKDDADRMFIMERRANRRFMIKEPKESLYNSSEEENKLSKCIKKLKFKLQLFKAYLSTFIEWLLADLTCKYGTDWKRPVGLWIILVLILFPILFWIGKGVEGASSWLECIYFSIVTATTLGYGDYHPTHGNYQFLAGAEAIFGTFMWAAFIAIFARKYMR